MRLISSPGTDPRGISIYTSLYSIGGESALQPEKHRRASACIPIQSCGSSMDMCFPYRRHRHTGGALSA